MAEQFVLYSFRVRSEMVKNVQWPKKFQEMFTNLISNNK